LTKNENFEGIGYQIKTMYTCERENMIHVTKLQKKIPTCLSNFKFYALETNGL
jgi:hypothetical protein